MSMKTLRRNNNHRRPPRDPSAAALRPKNALEQQAMQSYGSGGFRQKVQQANANTICNSTSDQVGRMSLRKLLIMNSFCVPIFQRRYCWTETQWKTLLNDASTSTQHRQQQHSLGRLTCTRVVSSQHSNLAVGVQDRSCILDGQQRFTTVTILLAAIRDMLLKLSIGGTVATVATSSSTIESINQLLFSDMTQMKDWMTQQSNRIGTTQLKEGEELSFARLVPTFCDRWGYYTAILPPHGNNNNGKPSLVPAAQLSLLPRPLQAKQFFWNLLKQDYSSIPKLTNLLRGVLDGLNMLYFPVDVNTNQNDGTDDLMVIYERLAMRDATFCKPTRKDEYQSMDGSDMIRNLLLGSFTTESDALTFYQEYWLPIEKLVERRREDRKSNNTMAETLQAFLHSEKPNDDIDVVIKGGIIGGQIYAEFQAWFADRLSSTGSSSNSGQQSPLSVEEKVRRVGKDLLTFARAM